MLYPYGQDARARVFLMQAFEDGLEPLERAGIEVANDKRASVFVNAMPAHATHLMLRTH